MTDSLLLRDLLLWSLQITVLVGAAAMLTILFRRSSPASRLAFLQLTLAGSLLLPLFRDWRHAVISASTPAVMLDGPVPVIPVQPVAAPPSISAILLALIAAGVLIRLLLMCAGLWKLRQHRIQSQPFASDTAWHVEAELRISDHVNGPVTFGFRKPVVLLPHRFITLDPAIQDAILCHEILHVRRHDWLFTVAEELVRAALWFHPAVWWLLREIQLAREETVDREAISMTRERDEYIDALLVIAGAPQSDVAPAPLFLRKRHLKQRIASILKEITMSKPASYAVLTVSLSLLATSGWIATAVLPLRAAPQLVMDAPGVSVDTRGAELMHRDPVSAPREWLVGGVSGVVVADAKVDASGEVTDVTVVSGPEPMRRTVIQSLLNWHFVPVAGVNTHQVSFTFVAPNPAGGRSMIAVARLSPFPGDSSIKAIEVSGLPENKKQELLNSLPVRAGDTLTSERFQQVEAAVNKFDVHLRVLPLRNSVNETTLTIAAPGSPVPTAAVRIGGGATGSLQPPPPPPPPPAPFSDSTPSNRAPIRVGSNVEEANILTKVAPVYPPLAKAARVQGTVQFQATIGTDGRVTNLQLLSGPPLLVQAAMQAVQQWTYKPTLLNGNPAEVITTIDINFTLDQ